MDPEPAGGWGKYNEQMVHSATGLTPVDATKEENEFYAKTNLEIKRISDRKYPELNVGNHVRVYKKKSRFAKERVPVWEDQKRRITGIGTSFGQKFYHVSGITRPLIRSNLLKVT